MNFNKKLRVRLALGITYIVLGLALIIVFNITETPNEYFSYWGLGLAVVGIVRVKEYFRITKNDDAIKSREIYESDERNIAIAEKARSVALKVYILGVSVAILVLQFINMVELATTLFYTVCGLLLVYWVAYLILRKKI